MGPSAAGVHQMSQGHHEQQSRTSKSVRSQGGIDVNGKVIDCIANSDNHNGELGL